MNKQDDFSASLLAQLDALYRTAYYLTHDAMLAEEMVQEVALKAIKKRHTFREGANFRPWIFAILRNTLADHFRRKKRQPVTFSLNDETHEQYVTLEGPDVLFYNHILDEEIEHALSRLSEEMRMAVLLVDVEEFSYQELAETLNWPLGTVMSRLYRGRRKLRNLLQELAQRRGYVKQR